MERNGQIPFVDPTVRHVGVAALREFNADKLRTLDRAVVFSADGKELAVLLRFDTFLRMQELARSVEKGPVG